jgi:hypothetical protein
MNAITKKILIINKLLLPNELIDIIKNYVFYNIIEETKKRKNKIISLFNSNNIYYSNTEKPDCYPDCPYPIISLICNTINNKYDKKWYFFLTYCKTCGKYVRMERLITYVKEYLHCDCY